MKNKYVSRLVTNVEQLKSSWGIELQTIGGKTLDATTAKVESLLRSATRAWNSCNVMESLGLTDALRHTSRLPSIHKKLTCGVVLVQVHVRLLHARLVAMMPERYIAVRKIIVTNLPLGWSAVRCYLYFQYLMFWRGKCLKKTCDFCTLTMSFVEGLYLFLRITLRICCTAVRICAVTWTQRSNVGHQLWPAARQFPAQNFKGKHEKNTLTHFFCVVVCNSFETTWF